MSALSSFVLRFLLLLFYFLLAGFIYFVGNLLGFDYSFFEVLVIGCITELACLRFGFWEESCKRCFERGLSADN